MQEILQRDNPVLRLVCRPVRMEEIGSKYISDVIDQMVKAMHSQQDAVGIAAPQIGKPLRIFVVSGKQVKRTDRKYKGEHTDMVFINPELIKSSKSRVDIEEGCLSVRWLYGKVRRSSHVVITALNEHGEPIHRGAGGILAQVFQHEIDHLNGVLFTDKARETWEMAEDEIARLQQRQN